MTLATRKPRQLSDSNIRMLIRITDGKASSVNEEISEALAELLALRWAKRRNVHERFPLGSKV